MGFGSVGSSSNIWSLSTELMKDVQRLINSTGRSLKSREDTAGEYDAELEQNLDMLTQHVRQYETEFLRLLMRHSEMISNSLDTLLAKLDRNEKVDPRLINQYAAALGKMEQILKAARQSDLVDMKRAQVMIHDSKSLLKNVKKRVKMIHIQLRKIGKRQTDMLRTQEKALKKGKT